jgi:hypothetical protein
MSHRYLEDVEDAIETAIQFEKYVKFMKKSMVSKPKHHTELPRLHAEGISNRGSQQKLQNKRLNFHKRKLESWNKMLIGQNSLIRR